MTTLFHGFSTCVHSASIASYHCFVPTQTPSSTPPTSPPARQGWPHPYESRCGPRAGLPPSVSSLSSTNSWCSEALATANIYASTRKKNYHWRLQVSFFFFPQRLWTFVDRAEEWGGKLLRGPAVVGFWNSSCSCLAAWLLLDQRLWVCPSASTLSTRYTTKTCTGQYKTEVNILHFNHFS